MKFIIISAALLALVSAKRLPLPKLDNQNELIENDNDQEDNFLLQKEYDSIANSFDDLVNAIRDYSFSSDDQINTITDEISIPDSIDIGSYSDTLLTNIHVTGLKNFDYEKFIMSWGEDLVYAETSWKNLIVNGVFNYMSIAGKFRGQFKIILVEPKYSGNTSLTKNADIYPMMSSPSSMTFKEALVDHTKLPALFQNEKPRFNYFIKNVVSQYVATTVANKMYNTITMKIRQAAKPYLIYRNDKIADDVTSPINGVLGNGHRFELKNICFNNTKNNMAKISFVQTIITDDGRKSARYELRLLDLTGESDLTIWPENGKGQNGKGYNGKIAYKFDRVKIVPTVDFRDKTVHTEIFVKSPRVEIKSRDYDSVDKSTIEQQLTNEFVGHFNQKFVDVINQKIKKNM